MAGDGACRRALQRGSVAAQCFVTLRWLVSFFLLHPPLMTAVSGSVASELEAAFASRSSSALQESKARSELHWSESDCAVALFEQPEH